MSLFRLVFREILFRKLGFVLGVLAVTVAVVCLVAQVLLLTQHDLRTEQILQAKALATEKEMAKLEDEIRKDMKNLGFNLRILPKDVNLLDFFAKDYADKYMPEDYAELLANTKIVSINHLLPILQQRVAWPERNIPVINLVGTRGEIPILSQEKKKPFIDAVPRGKIVLGHELRGDHTPGSSLVLMGRKFSVQKIHPQRGDQDDITVWVHLSEAQELLVKPKLINGMLALGCNCTSDRLSVIRQEIADILPETRVEEHVTKATVRAEARTRVGELAKSEIEREKRHRETLRADKEALASILAPLVLLGACVWVGLLSLANVRERRGEIGLYRALGLGSFQLFGLFLARAKLVGLLGAVLGLGAGVAAAFVFGDADLALQALEGHVLFLVLVLVAAPAVSALAAWLPALLAVRQDPAAVLQQEMS